MLWNRLTDGPTDEPMDGPMDGPTDGPTDEWMDGQVDAQRFKQLSSLQRLTIFNFEDAYNEPGVQYGSIYDHNDFSGNNNFWWFCLDANGHTDAHTDGEALM